MSDKFEITYGVDDGYAGRDRPQYVSIDVEELEEDMDEDELDSIFWQIVEESFQQTVSYYSEDRNKFVTWAKEKIQGMTDD